MNSLNREELMLAKLDQVMRQLRRRPAGKQHLGRGVYRIISQVKQKDEISTRELADALGMRPSSLNEKLSRLEQEKIILRERNPMDQRMFLVKLLPAGEDLLEEMRLERKKMNKSISTILTDEEMEMLTALADKLAGGLSNISQGETECQ